ncbi:MAG: hypothetical protein RL693_2653, partial [Verrucomicrobiota bacterium]
RKLKGRRTEEWFYQALKDDRSVRNDGCSRVPHGYFPLRVVAGHGHLFCDHERSAVAKRLSETAWRRRLASFGGRRCAGDGHLLLRHAWPCLSQWVMQQSQNSLSSFAINVHGAFAVMLRGTMMKCQGTFISSRLRSSGALPFIIPPRVPSVLAIRSRAQS